MTTSLLKNAGIYVAIGFLSQGLVALLWVILAKWLHAEEIGLYGLALFVVEFFSTLCVFGLDSVLTRFYYSEKKVSMVLGNAFLLFLLSNTVALSLFFLGAPHIPLLIGGLSNILDENMAFFAVMISANAAANIILVHYAALKEAWFYAQCQFFKTLFFFLASLALIHAGFGILGVFYALLFSAFLVMAIFIVRDGAKQAFSFSPSLIREVVHYGYPLMLYGLSNVVITYFSRLLLDRYTDLSTLGIYTFFLTLVLQINGLCGSFSRAWMPEVFENFLQDRKKAIDGIVHVIYMISFVYLAVMFLGVAAGHLFLFKWILKESYQSQIHIFYILLLAPLFSLIYAAGGPLYYYENKTKKILYISLVLNGMNIVVTFFLIQSFHQVGAAFSFFFMSILTVFIYLLSFRRAMAIPVKIVQWTSLLSVVLTASAVLLVLTASTWLFLLFLIVSVFLSYKLGSLSANPYFRMIFCRS